MTYSVPLPIVGRVIGTLIVISAIGMSVWVARLNYLHPRTDDAFVRTNIIGIAPHVSGPLVDLRIEDNQFVREGDLLFVIDPRPYEIDLQRANAALALTLKEVQAQESAIAAAMAETNRRSADLASAEAEVARREAEKKAAQDAVTRLKADFDYAEDYLGRVEPLLKREFVTEDRVAEARTKRDSTAAAMREAHKRLSAAEAAVTQARAARLAAAATHLGAQHEKSRADALLAQIGNLNARVEVATAAVRAAELNVEYCRVRAPFNAYVTNLNIAVGEYAREGQPIFALVDSRKWYVLANFRETYLGSIRNGMSAEVYLLSYPGRPFRGVVQGIGWANYPADGATLGVLPDVQKNLNWVRLATRFPVRILLQDADPNQPFRMGATAVVTVKGPQIAQASLGRNEE